MFKNYLKTGWRNLIKHTTISLINIAGLSVSMAAAIFILLWIQNELSFDNFHPKNASIYQVTFSDKTATNKWDGSPLLFGEAAVQSIAGVQKATKFLPALLNNPVLNINNEFYKEKTTVYVDSNWFSFFNYNFVEGNAIGFNQNPNSIILTEALAKKYYGKKEAVGNIILIDSVNYKVQAVIKDNPSNSSFQFNLFLPLQSLLSLPEVVKKASAWNSFSYTTFIRINSKTDVKKVSGQLAKLLKKESHESEAIVSLIPLQNIHFETEFGDATILRQNKKIVFIFAAIGLLLLLIACINYITLSIARASMRTKEVSIKKIMGAGRVALFKQFMAESLVTSVIAFLITLCIVWIGLPAFDTFTDQNISFSITSAKIWMVLGGTFIFTHLLISIYPSLLLSSVQPLNIARFYNTKTKEYNAERSACNISVYSGYYIND